MAIRVFIYFSLLFGSLCMSAQNAQHGSPADAEKKFSPYMYWRHGGPDGLAQFKKEKPSEFSKELWYYSSSFEVRRDYFPAGVSLDESIIDISRFEKYRLQDKPYILELPGFKDALVLCPANELLWSPGK